MIGRCVTCTDIKIGERTVQRLSVFIDEKFQLNNCFMFIVVN